MNKYGLPTKKPCNPCFKHGNSIKYLIISIIISEKVNVFQKIYIHEEFHNLNFN